MHIILFLVVITILITAINYIKEFLNGGWILFGLAILLFFVGWYTCKKFTNSSNGDFFSKFGNLNFNEVLAIALGAIFFSFFCILLFGGHEIGAFWVGSFGIGLTISSWYSNK